MKIVSDCRYVRVDHHDGISRYSSRITAALGRLAAASGHEVTMLICDERQLALLPDLPWAMGPSPTGPGSRGSPAVSIGSDPTSSSRLCRRWARSGGATAW
ncbi:hypothetical protein GCM10025881_39470 [Pseudolysinimonas kribbensis]|uniref:Glycosyltransferase subfamily 4-like N-terminal domain-containing protein n=1 Tax=Pseudolysinimonas kribbensis TaxID=433641 RepID=A0ABQ6K8Z1_9MICO|nr:hypothetical protein GCM10025881_00390 [Pseudolysinimonas kribbensis]GMA97123.1 hypothetical protein GCM10025881_39470 [Pseudolysinimonas kribbensis]